MGDGCARATTSTIVPGSCSERVGLGGRGDRRVSELSHGEQRQLEIAMALATEPRLLLLDEPAAGLPAAERARLRDLLASLPRSLPFLLIEHDMSFALGLTDRVLCLHNGLTVDVRHARRGARRRARPGRLPRPSLTMLDVRDLHAGYATARVLQGATLRVDARQVVALLGRNGMGKTTLLRAISGLRPPHVASGSIRFEGHDLAGHASHEVARRGLSLVPQGRRVFRSLSVVENLRVAARPADGGWSVERVFELFPRLAERPRQAAATLSGGEQQMLAIGRSLMTNPRLLLMDEPSEGLSPQMRDLLADRIGRLRDDGQAVLIAEQNVDLALAVADRVDVLGESGHDHLVGRPGGAPR